MQGRLQFTGDALKAERIQATLLGMPLAFDLKTAGNGNVRINADGRLNVADLRQQWTHPLLDRLSGSAAWQGTVLARKKSAEIIFESTLQGLASTLPEPFSKLAEASLPLRIERRQRNAAVATALAASAAAVGDQLDLHLGELLSIRLLRRQEPGRAERGLSVERGAMTIGSMSAAGAAGILSKMPDKGVALAVNLPALDLDLWRSLLQPAARDTATNHDPDDGANARASALPLTSLNLKTPLLTLQGYRIADLAARATLGSDGIWRSELKSRDINGELSWKGQGSIATSRQRPRLQSFRQPTIRRTRRLANCPASTSKSTASSCKERNSASSSCRPISATAPGKPASTSTIPMPICRVPGNGIQMTAGRKPGSNSPWMPAALKSC